MALESHRTPRVTRRESRAYRVHPVCDRRLGRPRRVGKSGGHARAGEWWRRMHVSRGAARRSPALGGALPFEQSEARLAESASRPWIATPRAPGRLLRLSPEHEPWPDHITTVSVSHSCQRDSHWCALPKMHEVRRFSRLTIELSRRRAPGQLRATGSALLRFLQLFNRINGAMMRCGGHRCGDWRSGHIGVLSCENG